MNHDDFGVARSFRVPGLGLLLVPAPPLPTWLTTHALHTALHLRLHRPGEPPGLVVATIEELAFADQPPARALLLDADPTGPVTSQARLTLVELASLDLQ